MGPKLTGSVLNYPARAIFVCYLGVIALGTLFLLRPVCTVAGRPTLSVVDAAFTATSATCVTGLTVRSTANDFSWLGQLVILLLIQLGGMGIMTVTTYILLRLGGREGLRHKAAAVETLGSRPTEDLRWVLSKVLRMVFICEGIGFVILAVRNLFEFPVHLALWHALFHSVSAFCNAGFALHDDSLTRYQGDVVVNLTICSLIVVGGIGFPVLLDVQRNWKQSWRELWERLCLHSKIMLIGTVVLLLGGMVAFLFLEWDNTLADMPVRNKLLVALFQSVTTRTAGFNTVEIAALTNATLFIVIILMGIGAGPCSTGGGVKVSTACVLGLFAWSRFRGFSRVTLFRRTIPQSTVERSVATVLLFHLVAVLLLAGFLVWEQAAVPHPETKGSFLDGLFEVVSALGTVGLSTGMTGSLSVGGRVFIILLMFIGRLGPIAAFAALSHSVRTERVEHVKEQVLIG